MDYDEENIFAKILKNEIPSDIVGDNKNAIAFRDIFPKAKIHILIIPKKKYVNYFHFVSTASNQEILDLNLLIKDMIVKFKLDKTGFRLISNSGKDSNQEVPHLHFHLLGGQNLKEMI